VGARSPGRAGGSADSSASGRRTTAGDAAMSPADRTCARCGISLVRHRRQAIYCSGPCRAAASRARAARDRRSPIPGEPTRAAVETAQNRTYVVAGGGYAMATPDEETRIAALLARHADLLGEAA
jgi:hypothetical protein